MAQFIAFSPDAEVSGVGLQTYISALGKEGKEILRRCGIDHIDPEAWYAQQPFLDALREAAEGDFGATLDLVNIGTKILEHASWPPHVRTIQEALWALDDAYHMHHRGDVGEYTVEQLDETTFVIVARTPYPCDFDYGLIYATAKHYLPADGRLVVEHAEGPCRKNGEESCTYRVRW